MSQTIAIQGPLGTWKSSLALAWKQEEYEAQGRRKFVFDLELGAHRAVPFAHGSAFDIWTPPALRPDQMKDALMFTRGDIIVGKMELWETVIDQYILLLNDPQYACIVFDTAKVLWETDHQSYLQELQTKEIKPGHTPRKQLQPIEYSNPNGRFTQVVGLARTTHKDLILINHERPKYITASVDGQMKEVPHPTEVELDGFSRTGNLADWMLQTTKDPKTKQPTGGVILKSPIGKQFVGAPFEEATFECFMKTLNAMGASSIDTVDMLPEVLNAGG